MLTAFSYRNRAIYLEISPKYVTFALQSVYSITIGTMRTTNNSYY